MSDLGDALKSMQDATPAYAKAKAYAHGPISEVFASPRLKRILKNKQVSFTDVLGDVVISAVADKLEITSITTDNDKATEALEAQDERNKMPLVRPHVMRKALEYGDAYMMVWPAADANGEATGDFDVTYHSPRTMRVLYDPENPMKPRLAIQRWAKDKRVRVNLYYPPETEDGPARIERYVSKQDGGRATSDKDFEPYEAEGEAAEEEHEFGFPVFHFTTTLPGEYGVPEHFKFYPTQDKLNKLTIAHMAGVDYTATPLRYALMEPDGDTSEAAAMDEDDFAVSEDGKRTEFKDGQGKSTFSAEPGSLWYQKGVKGFGQFDPADPKYLTDPQQFYLNRGAYNTSTPLYLFPNGGDFPSGKALRTANAPLDKKTNARKMSFDATWDALYTHLLKLLGFPDVTLTITWAPIQTVDEDEKVALAQQKQAAGVPAEQTLKDDLGYDGDTVDQWLEDGEALVPQKIELVGKLAGAISSLVPAESAHVLEEGSVNALFKMIVDEIRGETGDDTEFQPDPVQQPEPEPEPEPTQFDPRTGESFDANGEPVDGGAARRGGTAAGTGRRVRRR
ncbi:phage portal protein [Amycolatopsis sp. NPDC006131]|uniref:phage portal protein n=1 Tax=Amycolatopsis sp. NPDC006131 TaxID=3156731 RepID=UPI0033B05990